MSCLFHSLAPVIEFRIIKVHLIAFGPLIRRGAINDGIGRHFQGIVRTAIEFTAFHRIYLLSYVRHARLYVAMAI